METAAVAVFADQGVHLRILAELCDAGRQHDQLAAIGHGHTGAVDGLVAQPCAFELAGIQIDHALFQPVLHKVDVFLLSQPDGFGQALPALTDEQAVGADAAAGRGGNGQGKENGAILQKVLHAVVEQLPYRGVILAHHALHAVHSAHHVAFVDHIAAAHAHKQIFGMVGHADDLVRHHLTGGDDQIVTLVHHASIDLHADGIVPQPFSDLLQISGGDLAQPDYVGAPVVGNEFFIGDVAEHDGGLLPRDRLVSPQRGEDIHLSAHVLQNVIVGVGDKTGVGVEPGKVGRQDQHTPGVPAGQTGQQRVGDLLPRQAGLCFRDLEYVHITHRCTR